MLVVVQRTRWAGRLVGRLSSQLSEIYGACAVASTQQQQHQHHYWEQHRQISLTPSRRARPAMLHFYRRRRRRGFTRSVNDVDDVGGTAKPFMTQRRLLRFGNRTGR